MSATGLAQAREPSTARREGEPGARRTSAGLLRPHCPALTAVVVLQVVGALAGLAPLLAVVELGRTLLASGPVDHGHVRGIVLAGAAGFFVRLLFTAASSVTGHLLDGRVQLDLRRRLAARLGRVPIGWFSRRRTGELAKVVGEDVSAVHPFIAHTPRRARLRVRGADGVAGVPLRRRLAAHPDHAGAGRARPGAGPP
ncbi:hypothetical protein GCM10020295_59030 [Streptomyces cinereospinus]